MKLSIVVPVYNEEKTLAEIISRVEAVKLVDLQGKKIEKQIIIVDDCSKDRSREILNKWKETKPYTIIFHKKNGGKGRALRTGFKHAQGDVILIQDADLEYSPEDYPKLLLPILQKKTKIVYGSRFQSPKGNLKKKHLTFTIHSVGNKGLTMITNMLFFSNLTDMETCYKCFTKEALDAIMPLRARRFDFEPEITAKFLKRGFKIKEVPINYFSRDFHEGKKITWRDGVKALFYLLRYRFSD